MKNNIKTTKVAFGGYQPGSLYINAKQKLRQTRKETKVMKKLTNKKGFTLMEMLIVVAIIVILVAISVPTFTSQLKKSRDAANDANERAAKAAATATYLTSEDIWDATRYYQYDAVNGALDQGTADTDAAEYEGYGQGDEKGKILYVQITKDGAVSVTWKAGKTT